MRSPGLTITVSPGTTASIATSISLPSRRTRADFACSDISRRMASLVRPFARASNQRPVRISLVYRHFPLVEVHPLASTAAEAAEFAGSHAAFWPMHQSIFANQQRLSASLLVALAAQLKLSPVALRDAIASRSFASKVQADFLGGVRSGVNGTPAFFVNGIRHDSPYGFADLPSAIDQAVMTAAA
jgi:protein-disulfide isomerase